MYLNSLNILYLNNVISFRGLIELASQEDWQASNVEHKTQYLQAHTRIHTLHKITTTE